MPAPIENPRLGVPAPILPEPPGLKPNNRKFRYAVINSGLIYAEFGALLWEDDNISNLCLKQKVYRKMQGKRGVSALELRLIRITFGEDSVLPPEASVKAGRVSLVRRAD